MKELTKLVTDLATSVKDSTETQEKLAIQVNRMADALYRALCIIDTLQNRVETLEKQSKS